MIRDYKVSKLFSILELQNDACIVIDDFYVETLLVGLPLHENADVCELDVLSIRLRTDRAVSERERIGGPTGANTELRQVHQFAWRGRAVRLNRVYDIECAWIVLKTKKGVGQAYSDLHIMRLSRMKLAQVLSCRVNIISQLRDVRAQLKGPTR
jgi:hypothetical protein